MIKSLSIIIFFSFMISSCSNNNITSEAETEKPTPGLFSKDTKKGISLDELFRKQDPDSISANVNGFLWRASLNVLSIAPLASTDALGGTIITDWYFNENIKNQRIKITAFIKTSELKSQGIEIKVHVQKLVNEVWSNTFTNKKLEAKIEDAILNEARNLRINSIKK